MLQQPNALCLDSRRLVQESPQVWIDGLRRGQDAQQEGRKIFVVRNMAHGLVMFYQCYAPRIIAHDLLFRKTAILAIDWPGIVSGGIGRPADLYVTVSVFLTCL